MKVGEQFILLSFKFKFQTSIKRAKVHKTKNILTSISVCAIAWCPKVIKLNEIFRLPHSYIFHDYEFILFADFRLQFAAETNEIIFQVKRKSWTCCCPSARESTSIRGTIWDSRRWWKLRFRDAQNPPSFYFSLVNKTQTFSFGLDVSRFEFQILFYQIFLFLLPLFAFLPLVHPLHHWQGRQQH